MDHVNRGHRLIDRPQGMRRRLKKWKSEEKNSFFANVKLYVATVTHNLSTYKLLIMPMC